jgi:hypothetical protein
MVRVNLILPVANICLLSTNGCPPRSGAAIGAGSPGKARARRDFAAMQARLQTPPKLVIETARG